MTAIREAWDASTEANCEKHVNPTSPARRKRQVPQFLPLIFELRAELELAEGRAENARSSINDALTEIERMAQGAYTAAVHRTLGEILLCGSRPETECAERAFVRALELARCQQTKTFELRAAISLARLYRATNRGEMVRDLLDPIIAGFESGAEFPELQAAKRLLEPVGAARDL
jgi:predicted ATPase